MIMQLGTGNPVERIIKMAEDVPFVVELRDGGPGVDGQAVTRIAASSVGDGTVVRARSHSIATASFARAHVARTEF